MSAARTLVLGDLHLSRHTPRAVDHALVSLLGAHGGTRVVFAGDFFDLSAESPRTPHEVAIREGFGAHQEVAAAVAKHLETGGEAVWLSGNHDPELGELESAGEIESALQLSAAAASRVKTSPWFFRDGALHVEHGHLFDPDNAPSHPLASPRNTLGVHFVEHFIAPTGAFAYLHANDKKPLELLVSAFRWYGKRGPFVVAKYFQAAFAALAKSGPFFETDARAAEGLTDFLRDAGLGEAETRNLLDEHATPTMTSLEGTMARLYFDRVTATISLLAGATAFAAGRRKLALVLGAAGLAGLAWSWSRGHDRYGGKVPERLDDGARRITRATGADLVIFGHAHTIVDRAGYSNTASFAFPEAGVCGRSFLEVEGTRAVRRFWV